MTGDKGSKKILSGFLIFFGNWKTQKQVQVRMPENSDQQISGDLAYLPGNGRFEEVLSVH